jgi:AcrR family transcriptional regulator
MFSQSVPESVVAGAPEDGLPGPGPGAVELPLDAARTRLVERSARLVAAARDLADERGSAAFTVHEVARRGGSSLKGFYRCFASKDDLLVALLAEDSLLGAEILDVRVGTETEPAARLRAYLCGLFELLTHQGAVGYARVLVREHVRLGEARADDLRAALAPMVDVLEREIASAYASSARRGDAQRDAQTVFALVLDGIHDVALGRAEPLDQAEYLWQFCCGALGVSTTPSQHPSDPEPVRSRPAELQENR